GVCAAASAGAAAVGGGGTGGGGAPEHLEPFLWARAERGRAFSSAAFLLAQQDMHRASRDVTRFFGDHDVWLPPTLGTPPVALGRLVYRDGAPFQMRRRSAEFRPVPW